MANLRPSSACKKSLCTRHRHMKMWDMWPRFQVQQQFDDAPTLQAQEWANWGLPDPSSLRPSPDKNRVGWDQISKCHNFQSWSEKFKTFVPKYTACLFPNTQDLQIRVVWICGFVSVGSLDSMSGPGRPTATGWPQLCPPSAPSFCGPSFKNHLTCTGWLATQPSNAVQ